MKIGMILTRRTIMIKRKSRLIKVKKQMRLNQIWVNAIVYIYVYYIYIFKIYMHFQNVHKVCPLSNAWVHIVYTL